MANWRNAFNFNNVANAIKLVLVFLASFFSAVVLRGLLPTSSTFVIILLLLPLTAFLLWFWWKTR